MDNPSSKSAADKKAARSSAIEEQIKEAQKRKEERAFLEELAKRIQLAREGKHHSDRKEFSEAITCYRRFLAITAQFLGVQWEELSPKNLDPSTRSSESLLISSILFDMLKILDKVDKPGSSEERKVCHRLFIRFTLGQAFQNHAAENLRKYLVYRKTIKHKAEFWATYNQIRTKGFCVVATWAFGNEEHAAVVSLRRFRDEQLMALPGGPAFTEAYYQHGESLVAMLSRIPGARGLMRGMLKIAVHLLEDQARK